MTVSDDRLEPGARVTSHRFHLPLGEAFIPTVAAVWLGLLRHGVGRLLNGPVETCASASGCGTARLPGRPT